MSCFQRLLGGMKAAFAVGRNQLILSARSALAEDALGWQNEAGGPRDLASSCPHISSLRVWALPLQCHRDRLQDDQARGIAV